MVPPQCSTWASRKILCDTISAHRFLKSNNYGEKDLGKYENLDREVAPSWVADLIRPGPALIPAKFEAQLT
jgi:hypothetical protein